MRYHLLVAGLVGAILSSMAVNSIQADTVSEFYKDKIVTLLIGNSAGGGYDRYARTLAQHMGKHIPGNPTILAKNMPGAGGLKLTRHMYTIAPKDRFGDRKCSSRHSPNAVAGDGRRV